MHACPGETATDTGIQTDGQKAFMTGKLKTKGNMMFATKLDGVLKVCLRPCYLSPVLMCVPSTGREDKS